MNISIIVPLYNKSSCIAHTLSTILEQSYTNFEIIIVNDGSTDDSVQIVKKIDDSRIKIINKKNGGVSSARNVGIKEAQGEWILFLDADDILMPDALNYLMILFKKYPTVDILSGDFITSFNNLMIKSSTKKDDCIIDNPFKEIWHKNWNLRLGSFAVKHSRAISFIDGMAKGEDVLYCWDQMNNCQIAYTPHDIMTYERENSSLSFKILPLEKCMSWYLSFNKVDKYRKLLSMDILVKGILFYMLHKPAYSFRLIGKHTKGLFVNLPYYLFKICCK